MFLTCRVRSEKKPTTEHSVAIRIEDVIAMAETEQEGVRFTVLTLKHPIAGIHSFGALSDRFIVACSIEAVQPSFEALAAQLDRLTGKKDSY